MNAAVYEGLERKHGVAVNILGQSRAPYDRYPAAWAQDGAPAPNLETFALDLAGNGCLEETDCLVVGSRGGQVVLPTLWQARGGDVPPTVVINGGCAMGCLPMPVLWPETAVTFLLLGGQDYFRGQLGVDQYLADAAQRVPRANTTTAILLVHQMVHMPQSELLAAILLPMIRAVKLWKSQQNIGAGQIPANEFRTILENLRKGSWSGKLTYKTAAGDSWKTEAFP
jgi:hypothetical protein